MFIVEAREILQQILASYFAEQQPEPFICFDREQDKLIILSCLSQDLWLDFLERMSA